MQSEGHIFAERRGRAGIISLNRPQAMNAIDLTMTRAIDRALDQFQADPAVEFVLMQSATDRAFCAGCDMRRTRHLLLAGQIDEAEQFFQEEYALIDKIARFPKPYISLIDGLCMGGGMGLSMHGKYRIATERAVFAMPETSIGFIPDVGGSYFLPRMPHSSGMWLGLTGASVRGFDAHGLRISTHMMAAEMAPQLLDELCFATQSIEQVLSALCASLGYQASILALADTTLCFEQPTLDSIVDCLGRSRVKPPQDALAALRKASPRSLKETLTLLREGRFLTLAECLQQEFDAMRRALRHPDLVEGVRALLVDKDHKPKWAAPVG
ncbi:enoyl-CoA hydratase/isomerase family protein [Thalassovita mediterranea]|uniref:3-hydroxyisobutyryl-CoA hydrolase n=1 Tax=Thalassovita mediterranea TaxID=340021 RepID=A0A0P1GPJ9_9RHOB|nr:enoyl-CoA hydratase/isomerase family protein [Thalassovita mediterranea]MCG7573315.1 enoyl-CoA hydratase/isomerase family protein [Phaeobacter sp. CNT1-3]CUH84240.1 putative enoyl-CoA hydratase echA8 [Thalassovita mediterranea]SIS27539.1 enoyl-CoA hydratase/3-hydroxyisobutyryl-CoA hydrolase [Thalassovita mediterranea]